jgi:Uma2 family endonuclease
MTEAEYLAFEDGHPEKHELVNGRLVPASGVTPAQNRLQVNLIVALGARLRGGPCAVNASNLRVHIPETGTYAYPDLSIVCGGAQYAPGRSPSLLNPTVIVEVLSESTAGYDLGAKAAHYRLRESVRTLLFVDSQARRIQRQDRNADGAWTLVDITDGEIELLGARLGLDEIYDGVEFE